LAIKTTIRIRPILKNAINPAQMYSISIRNQLIFQFLEMILWDEKRSLNRVCKVSVNPVSIAC